MSAAEIVNVNTNIQARAVSGASFSFTLLALVLSGPQGTAWTDEHGTDLVVTVTPSDWRTTLAALGFTSTDRTYRAVRTHFTSQDGGPIPQILKLGRRGTAVAQVETVDVAASTAGTYTITLMGQDYSTVVVAETQAQIQDALLAALGGPGTITTNGISVTVSASEPNGIVFTASEAGVPFTLSVTHSTTPASITRVVTTPSVGPVEDLAAWRAEDDAFYFVAELTRSLGIILAFAAEIETTGANGDAGKLLVGQTSAAGANTNGTDDLGALISPTGLNYARTLPIYDPDDDNLVDMALLSRMGPKQPGQATWAGQPLTGVVGSEYPTTINLRAKNYTWLEAFPASQGGFAMTQGGRVGAGIPAQLIRGRDWLNNQILIAYLRLLRDNDVVPFTDDGIGMAEAALDGVLSNAASESIRFLDTYTISPPKASDFDETVKSSRRLPNMPWVATPRGAIEGFDSIQGDLAA